MSAIAEWTRRLRFSGLYHMTKKTRWFSRDLVELLLLEHLRKDGGYLPMNNLELIERTGNRVRRLTDPLGENRWLHHRWVRQFEETMDDLAKHAPLPPTFSYVCMGAGAKNPLAFTSMMMMAGAVPCHVVEPGLKSGPDDWSVTWGFKDVVSRILVGNIQSKYIKRGLEGLVGMVDVASLYDGKSLSQCLRPDTFKIHPTYMEDADISPDSVDLLTSRSVLEHVQDTQGMTRKIFSIMRPGGVCLHDIDLSSHDRENPLRFYYTDTGPSHGNKAGNLNELRLSDHVGMFEKAGFACNVIRSERLDKRHLDREKLRERFQKYPEDVLLCNRAVLLAKKCAIT